MEADIAKFMERMQVPSKRLGIKELRQREETWRALWSWLDDESKFLILRVGSVVRIVRRDYKGVVGELGQVKLEPREYEVTVYEKVYNQNDGKYYFESKVVLIPAGAVMWREFITEQELAEEEETYAVAPLEEEGLTVG